MSPSRKQGGNGEDDPRAAGEEMVEVVLRRSVGRRGGQFYGPGRTKVPRSLYESIKLSPDLVATDGAGNPLPDTVAASVYGADTSSTTEHDAHPTIKRDEETGDPLEDQGAANSARSTRAAEIAEHAAKGPERQGGQLVGESGSATSNLDAHRQPLPGQTEPTSAQREQAEREQAVADANANAGGGSGGSTGGAAGRVPGVEGAKPLTKSELKSMDRDVLDDLARRNNVKVPAGATKTALVDRLYKARITLD